MSASTAKETRRQIRRALGADGLAAVNGLGATVHTQMVPALDHHAATLRDLSREQALHDRQLENLHDRLTRLENDARAFSQMTRWQRLRWAMRSIE